MARRERKKCGAPCPAVGMSTWPGRWGCFFHSHISREGKPAGFLLPLASPSPTFVSQPASLLEIPGELSRKGPTGSATNGSPGWAPGPLWELAVGPQSPQLSCQQWFFKQVPYKPGCWDMLSWRHVSPCQASCVGEKKKKRRGGDRHTDRQTRAQLNPPLASPWHSLLVFQSVVNSTQRVPLSHQVLQVP